MSITTEADTAAPALARARHAGALQGVIVALPATLAAMGTVLLIPVLPRIFAYYAAVENSDYLIEGGILTLPALCIALFSPLAGWLGDRYGRRSLLIASTTIYAFVGSAPLFIDNIYLIIATRFLVGVCEAFILTSSTTLICDYFSGFDRQKWLAGQIAIAAVAAVVLTVAGGAIGAAFGWRAPFALYGLSLLIAVAALLFTWEPDAGIEAGGAAANTAHAAHAHLRWKRLLSIMAVTLFGSIMFYVLQTQNGNALASLGVNSPAIIGAISGAMAVGVTLGTFAFRVLTRHYGVDLLIVLGFVFAGAGYVWIGTTHDFHAFSIAAFATNLGVGMLMPAILVWAVAGLPFELRGRGNGIWAGTWAAGQFVAALLANYLQRNYGGWLQAYYLIGEGALAISAAAILTIAMRRYRHRRAAVTAAVLRELDRAPDARFREIMQAAVGHLHAFVREAKLTESEFHRACAYIAKLGQLTTPSHNEVVLIAGSLGISSLVCQLNSGNQGQFETTANLLGPFWRMNSPRMANGESIVRSTGPGVPIFVTAHIQDLSGNPVAGAEVDVWHASADGFYENQDPDQADMNFRGKFFSDEQGSISFRSIKPRGYPIPVSGPVGELLRAQGRHNLRPAHIHFLIFKPGFKTQFAQVYSSDDPNLQTDVQFGVTRSLIGHYVAHDTSTQAAPDPDVRGPWYTLEHTFVIESGEARLPNPPVTGKASGERPSLVVLERSDVTSTSR